MRNQAAVMMVAAMMTATGAMAKNKPAAGVAEVSICLSHAYNAKNSELWAAKGTAGKIFANIGVALHWADMKNCPAGGLGIEFRPSTPENEHPGALAFSYPYAQDGIKIVILMDRVNLMAYGREGSAYAILGHVLAHEIGHVLLANDSHSSTGLMTARWTEDQIGGMRREPLSFTRLEAQMIRDNLTSGLLRLATR